MSSSTCMKCGGVDFEVMESGLRIGSSEVVFVRCTSCGGVVGAVTLPKKGKRVRLPEEGRETSKFEVEL